MDLIVALREAIGDLEHHIERVPPEGQFVPGPFDAIVDAGSRVVELYRTGERIWPNRPSVFGGGPDSNGLADELLDVLPPAVREALKRRLEGDE